jgi:amino acid transporter
MAMAVVVGTVIGSGVFKKPQQVAASTPFFGEAVLVWVLGGVLAFLGALALAEVAVLLPRAGGNYVFLREGYGRLAGFLFGWVEFWIIRGASLAALSTIFTESLHDILRELIGSGPGRPVLSYWEQKLLTVAIIVGLALVNVRGVRWGGLLQLLITMVKVGSLLGILFLPFLILALGRSGGEGLPDTDNLTPLWPAPDNFQLGALITSLLAVLWAYHGWMNVAPVAEEVRNPQRNLPLALLGGTVVVIALYLGANFAYSLVIPPEEMARMKDDPQAAARAEDGGLGSENGGAAGDAAPPADQSVVAGFGRRLLGPVGVLLASAAVMFSVFGALNGNLLVGPRLLYAMGEDGLAPRALGAVHPRFHTPAVAILVMAVWSALLVLAAAALVRYELYVLDLPFLTIDPNPPEGKPLFDIFTDFAMFGAVIFETLAVSTIFVFRWRLPHADRPYRCWGYPVLPAVYVVVLAMVLGNMFFAQQTEALAGLAFIALGAGVYALIRRRPSRPAAFLAAPGTP